MKINWSNINHFTPEEFSEDPDRFADPKLIIKLNIFRGLLGIPVYPSPVPGALARFDGDPESRHYAVGRQSDAVDVFCNCGIFRAWTAALHSGLWGGIGVYFDTKFRGGEWPMLHLDCRSKHVLWYREEHRYFIPANTGSWAFLGQLLARKVSKKS